MTTQREVIAATTATTAGADTDTIHQTAIITVASTNTSPITPHQIKVSSRTDRPRGEANRSPNIPDERTAHHHHQDTADWSSG